MKNFISALLDLFLPRRCAVCGRILSLKERHVCTGCLADLPRTFYSRMRTNPMSDRFNALLVNCPEITRSSFATSLFYYRASTGYRNITKRLKYHSDMGTGRYFAAMLGREMAASELYSDVDTVIPVPLHWTRKWARGYNQARVIAEVLASCLGANLLPRALCRRRRTRTQTRLSLAEKARNVEGAFRVRKGVDLSGSRHILLVDDVFTTGATMKACCLALSGKTGPETRISVATLACVG